MTRKVKDAKDLETNELIYFRGHAIATYMSDGRTIEDAINDIHTHTNKPTLDKITIDDVNWLQDIKNKISIDGENIKIDTNLYTTGGITMFGNDGEVDIPTIFDSLPIDGTTIYWDNGVLKAAGGGGGGVTDLTSAMIISALGYTPFNSASFTKASIKATLAISDWALETNKPTYTYSEVGAAASSHTHTKSQITDFPTSLPASDVSAWAKASTKPSYNFSEIGTKPTTLSGYGITDAKIVNGVITLGTTSITPLTSHQSLSGYATETWVSQNFNKYVLPAATSTALGGIKLGYTDNNKNYKVQLDTSNNAYVSVPWTDTVYTHPSATAYSSGLYKITTNALGHVTAATAVVKTDITALGIPAQDTTYGVVTTSANGLMSSSDKSKLDGIATGAEVNVQPDWNETITTSDAFIKNKPTIPTNTNQLTNGAGFITGINKTMVTNALGYTPPTSDTNTHYTTRLYAGTSATVSNTAITNPYLKVTDDNIYSNQIQFKGGGATVVSSDANGVITISSTDTNTWRGITDSVSTTDSTISGSATAVKTAYDKAVSAYNLANEKTSNTGTITGITMNGVSKGTSGVVDLGTVITDISGKQNTLVSGTNIKTVNGESLLGSGNVTVGYKSVTTLLITDTTASVSLLPNDCKKITNALPGSLSITLTEATNSSILNEYFIEFTTGSSGNTISFPSDIKWANGEAPSFEASTTYQISIVNNLGIVTKFK